MHCLEHKGGKLEVDTVSNEGASSAVYAFVRLVYMLRISGI